MIDLHTHTLYSDGTDEPIELLKKAEEKGIEILSITDHNTAKAYEILENIEVSEYFSGRIIPGIELNTKILGIPIEILGYGIDYKKMNELLPKYYLPAEERNRLEASKLVEKCKAAGIKLEENCLDNYDATYFASKFIQNEILKFDENLKLFSKEALTDLKVFYRQFMSNPECPLYLDPGEIIPDFDTAANLIRECGGLVFIPHIFEYRENSRKILEYILKNHEFDGIECYYTTFTEEQTEELVLLCKERGIYMSGGSDYHGKAKPDVDLATGYGNLNIKKDVIGNWDGSFFQV
ncbi:MAG: PHP domain-containing protein [Clostridia bacterium]|nr:PHP domain-containing protein [Clostridia bacterium]